MKFTHKHIIRAFALAGVFLLLQCNLENEDEEYYEPLVEGTYQVEVDENQTIEFIIDPNKPTSVEDAFDNGINFKFDLPEKALQNNQHEIIEAKISLIDHIKDFSDDYTFHFGYVLSPSGIYFNDPAKMVVELPPEINIKDFKGFIFDGGESYQNGTAEIWNIKMTPVTYKTINGKKYAEFEIPHFSGVFGISGKDFDCGNPSAAESCDDLKEIIACNIAGKEELTNADIERVNKALRVWLEEGLKWLEQNPSEIDEQWEAEYAIEEIICWEAAALKFNSDLSVFEDLLKQVAEVITKPLTDKLIHEDSLCSTKEDVFEKRDMFEGNFYLMNLVTEIEASGIIDEVNINQTNFCNSFAPNFFENPLLDTTSTYIQRYFGNKYIITFPPEENPPIARSFELDVFAYNLLGEPVDLELSEDYTIQLNYYGEQSGISIEGTTITERIGTCYRHQGNNEIPYACYLPLYENIVIQLIKSKQFLEIEVRRHGG